MLYIYSYVFSFFPLMELLTYRSQKPGHPMAGFRTNAPTVREMSQDYLVYNLWYVYTYIHGI